MNSSINTSESISVLFTEFTNASMFNLVKSYWDTEILELISLFTSDFIFCNDSTMPEQVIDHGWIMSKLTGWIILKKKYVWITSNSNSNVFTKITFFWCFFEYLMPNWYLQLFCAGPRFVSMSPSIKSCFEIIKIEHSIQFNSRKWDEESICLKLTEFT